MSKGTLFDKVWDLHTVGTLSSGQTQLFIGLHLVHEVTSPQAFAMVRERQLTVMYPQMTVATVDHIVPTESQARPFADPLAEAMMQSLEQNCRDHGIRFHNIGSGSQGIVHVIAPEQGLTQPGLTIACAYKRSSCGKE
jgi:3-isopropylmalate/(R)-2-methylmalate dehydratase large subunit